jgi:hypothetical protein
VKNGWKRGFRVGAIAATALLVTGGAVAVAEAALGAHAKQHVVKHDVRAGVHADVSLVRADGSTDAFALDRGRVTVASATSLTLQCGDGKTVKLDLSSSTIVRGTVATGEPVLVFSRNGVAFRVSAPGARMAPLVAKAAAKAKIVHVQVNFVRADGSTGSVTLDRGRVTATSSTSLTITREDGKNVTFTIGTGALIRGKLAAGARALVFSRDGAAFRVLAGPTSTG